jgi:hypothetical protein
MTNGGAGRRERKKRSGRSASASFEAHASSHLKMRFFLRDEPHPESLTDNSRWTVIPGLVPGISIPDCASEDELPR